ncbi:MAG: IS3 family transposase [Firmicutes bacterium]|nr:IS3 family transposase [Bacillota bacterium]
MQKPLESIKIFESFKKLEYLSFDYVNRYNNLMFHGSLNYLTPVRYRISIILDE